jgi:flagellar basal body rod protein FlgF
MAASTPVVLASDQSAIPVSGSLSTTTPADGLASGSITAIGQDVTLTVNGQGSVAVQVTGSYNAGILATQASVDGTNFVQIAGRDVSSNQIYGGGLANQTGIFIFAVAGYQFFRILSTSWATGTAVVTIRAATGANTVNLASTLPATGAQIGVVGCNQNTSNWTMRLVDGTTSQAAKVKAASTAAVAADPALVVAISPNNSVAVSATGNATATLSNVAASATSVTLLASNANRKAATIWNDSTAILYVKFGTTASTTSCTVKLIADAYYEVPGGYTGLVDGIWASATGTARISEITV